MDIVLPHIFAIIFIALLVIGTFGNGFTVLVNMMDWVKRRKLSSMDQLLTALAIIRISLFGLELLGWWLCVFYPALLMPEHMLMMMYIARIMMSHFSIWLVTCLSIFYLFKIANFSNFVFLYLKWRFRKVISGTLLVSLVFLVFHIVLISKKNDVWISAKRSLANDSSFKNHEQFSRLFWFPNITFTCTPFVLSLTAFLLLIFSLWKHLKNLQHRILGSRDASTTAHITALKTMVAFFLLYVTFFLSLVVEVFAFQRESSLFIFVVRVALVVGHTYVLILGNSKLRQACFKVLQWWRSRFKNMELSGP